MTPSRVCDPHHHLWSLPPNREYVIEDLRADLESYPRVTSTVSVECGAWYRADGPEHLRVVGETEWVAAHADPVTVGIVGAADLRLGDLVEETLTAHLEAGGGRFRGVRHMATWDPSPLIKPLQPDPGPELLLDPRFRAGFRRLCDLGLSFDAWVYFPQLPDLVSLARAVPEATIVLNHLGGPICFGPYAGRRAEVLQRWRDLMVEVAACPNVVVKLGGIGMPIYGLGWHKQDQPPEAADVAAAWRDPIRWCIETFGVERCMFESNFPVDRLSMSYATLWQSFELVTDDLGPHERAALFHDTACAVYRLPSP